MFQTFVFNNIKNDLYTGSLIDFSSATLKIMLVKLEMFDDYSIPMLSNVDTGGYIESNYEIIIGTDYRNNGYERQTLQNVISDDSSSTTNIISLDFKSDDVIFQTVSGIDAGGAIIYSEETIGVDVVKTPIVAINFGSVKGVDTGNYIVKTSNGFLRLE